MKITLGKVHHNKYSKKHYQVRVTNEIHFVDGEPFTTTGHCVSF